MKNIKSCMRIAMISEHGDPLAPLGGQQAGGQNVYVYELSKALSRLGVKVDVFTRWEDKKTAHMVRFSTRAKVIRLKAGPRNFISKDKFMPLMDDFVQSFLDYTNKNKIKYDLLHCHYYFSGYAGLKIKKILKIPVVETFHSLGLLKRKALGIKDSSPKIRTQIEKSIIQNSDKIIATCPQEKIDMISDYCAKPSHISVIPAGVNLSKFFPLEKKRARKYLNLPENKKIIVFAGKMEQRKGGLTLIYAIDHIRKTYPSLFKKLQVLMFSGDPRVSRKQEKVEAQARHDLQNEIDKHKITRKIILMPGIDQKKLHLYYAASNVVVMPSYYEPFGMVAIEAMASGTPVVASDVGGLKWTIDDNITGLHANPKDPKDFAKQIVKILSDDRYATRLGHNAIVKSRQKFSWPLIAKKIFKLYSSIINKTK